MQQASKNYTLFSQASKAWEVMLADCEQAQKSICLEQYWLQPDTIGRRFLDVLKAKAAQGVAVRILCDSVGSWTFFRDKRLQRELARHGVQMRWYNSVLPFVQLRMGRWFFRDHRKLLVIDSNILHIGGVGLSQHMHSWRDTHGRIVGAVASQALRSFTELWYKCRKPGLHSLKRQPMVMGQEKDFDLIPNSQGPGRGYIYRAIRDAVKRSKKRIWVIVPYFIPDLPLFDEVIAAVNRGVDVRLILPAKSDLKVVAIAMRSYFGMALHSGVQVYLYEPSILHAKAMVVDDNWATFGSMNWDNTSFRFNLEANVITTNPGCVQEIANQFLQDMELSKVVDYEKWKARPWTERLMEILVWPIHGFL